MTAAALARAFGSTGSILENVSPEQFDLPTPCASWAIRDLVNHVVGGSYFFATVAETGAMPTFAETPDFTAGDIKDAFATGAAKAVAAFSADGAMDTIMTLPFGSVPGSVASTIAAIDIFVHGWDLAVATGQPTDLDPELAGELLQSAQRFMSDSLRGEDRKAAFGPKVDVAESAPLADRLAGFMGHRRPA